MVNRLKLEAATLAGAGVAGLATGLVPLPLTASSTTIPETHRCVVDQVQTQARAGAEVQLRARGVEKAKPFRVITYNTAFGSSRPHLEPPERFLELPFYRSIIRGQKDAPILALQEVGAAQARALHALAQKNGNFSVIHIQRPKGQGNTIVVPRRFEVLQASSDPFHANYISRALDVFRHDQDLGDSRWPQIFEPRMYNAAKLRDCETGSVFWIVNTHLATEPTIALRQLEELAEEIREMKREAPVILAGDLNTHAAGTDRGSNEYVLELDAKKRAVLEELGLTDFGPTGRPANASNIDWITADPTAFEPAGKPRWFTGESLSLPGYPNARALSDHYAEEVTMRMTDGTLVRFRLPPLGR